MGSRNICGQKLNSLNKTHQLHNVRFALCFHREYRKLHRILCKQVVAKIRYIFRSFALVLEANATSKFSKEIVGLTGIARNYGGKDSRKTESLGFCLGFRWGKKIGFFLANETLNASKWFFRHEPMGGLPHEA